jgi:Skp family chaperone for outer membrane proteins
MTKNWTKLALFALITFVAVAPATAQTRIGTIDLRKVFDGYWKTQQADRSLKERAAELDKEHKSMIEGFRVDEATFTNTVASIKDQAVSEEERERRQKSAEEQRLKLQEKGRSIEQYERQARTTLDEQRKRMRENILTEIKSAINSKAKAAGYSYVLDTAAQTANDTPFVLYSTGENDLTDEVLTHLNVNAPEMKEEPPAAEEQSTSKKLPMFAPGDN